MITRLLVRTSSIKPLVAFGSAAKLMLGFCTRSRLVFGLRTSHNFYETPRQMTCAGKPNRFALRRCLHQASEQRSRGTFRKKRGSIPCNTGAPSLFVIWYPTAHSSTTFRKNMQACFILNAC